MKNGTGNMLRTAVCLFISLWMFIGCTGSDPEGSDRFQGRGSNTPLSEKDFRQVASQGIDDRLNSYPWAMEQFDGDGDGTPEIYIGTLNNAMCVQAPLFFWLDLVPFYSYVPPERWQCPNELWDLTNWEPYLAAAIGPAYVYQGRYDEGGGVWKWKRVWEPDLNTEVLGFRGARVFNDALYFLSNHVDNAAVWKTTDGINYERASPPGMGNFGVTLSPGFRGAQVFKNKLYITSDKAPAVFCSSDPSSDPGSWDQANSMGFVESGGGVQEFVFVSGKATGATENTLIDDTKHLIPMLHAGRLVRITGGTGAGQSMLILANTMNTLTIKGTWATIPDATSQYEIYVPTLYDSGPIWQLAVFNDHLYAITSYTTVSGPELWKSADPAPGNWTRVIEEGFGNPSVGFMSLRAFRDHLYIGTGSYPPFFIAGSAIEGLEVLRVDAEDNVELVVGKTRPAGAVGPDPVEPISGLDQGFGHLFNFYTWYMGEHDGWFYVGTGDLSSLTWDLLEEGFPDGYPTQLKWLQWLLHELDGPPGFDLWRTQNGVEWFEVTDTGFGKPDNFGVRNLLSTRWGLFLGATNTVDGFEIWLGKRD